MLPVNQPSVRNYNNVGTRNNGFQYRIMPLSFNLQQKGNSLIHKTDNGVYKIGDTISGKCLYDKKVHIGKVVNIIFDINTNKPLSFYIMDSKTRQLLPIKADTAKYIQKNVHESYNFDKLILKYQKSVKL